ncbi:protein kinase [Lipomyces chichibuensis]|uniref:protein kinase n=1 Tax=Lipomyces chichibuensis TaxID=1546026 RepID=UPI00334329F2
MTTTESSWQFIPSSLDDVEQIENYRTGGFHPVSIGDSFSRGRYRVLHKLGFGGFSTVWLARDEQSHRLVSLKIMTAEASNTCDEMRILQYLKDSAICHPACAHILCVLDHFTIDGPNGSHSCLVSPFAGPSLAQMTHTPGKPAGTRRLRGALARKFAKQVTLTIGYMHSRGVAHGDLTSSNILIQLAHVDSWSDHDVYERLGFPVTAKVRAWSGELNDKPCAPDYLVESANLSNLEYKWFTERVILVDFGQSFFLQTSSAQNVAITVPYFAPEVFFEEKASNLADIWALGCMIFEIRAGFQLFESFFNDPDDVIRQMVQTFGKLPEPWWSSWDRRNDYFDEDGKPKIYWPNDIPLSKEYPLVQLIRDIGSDDYQPVTDEVAVETHNVKSSDGTEPETKSMFESMGMRLSDTEVEVFEDLLHKVLRYNPEQRPQVQEIIEHSWFTICSEGCSTVMDPISTTASSQTKRRLSDGIAKGNVMVQTSESSCFTSGLPCV